MTKEEAIRRIKAWNLDSDDMEVLSVVIPELSESEDERIRKFLIQHISEWIGCIEHDLRLSPKDVESEKELAMFKDGLAYLERQKENVEKEYVFRPLAGTDITDAAKQAIRRANEGDCLVLAFNGAYIPVRNGNNAKELVEEYDAYLEKQKERKCDERDFTIYHPLKNGKGEYECIPYSFCGSLTSFSEDKDLIDFLRTCFYTEEECNEWIEQQKEQNRSCNNLDDEIQRFFDECIEVHDAKIYGVDERVITVDCYELTAYHFAQWQKEQKPVHTAKEVWKEMRLQVYAQASGNRHEPNYSDDSTKMFSLCDIDEIFEKIDNSTVGSQPAEWSEEEENDIQEASRCLRDYANNCVRGENSKLYIQNLADRIESLRPQPHLVRALTDNELERKLCDLQDRYPDTSWEYGIIGEAIEYIRQPHWKPSAVQMTALSSILPVIKGSGDEVQEILESLYDDLKKLM